jgi:hypothetical protein
MASPYFKNTTAISALTSLVTTIMFYLLIFSIMQGSDKSQSQIAKEALVPAFGIGISAGFFACCLSYVCKQQDNEDVTRYTTLPESSMVFQPHDSTRVTIGNAPRIV